MKLRYLEEEAGDRKGTLVKPEACRIPFLKLLIK